MLPFMRSTVKSVVGTVNEMRFDRFLELKVPAIDVHVANSPVIMSETEHTLIPIANGKNILTRPLKNSTGSESW